MLDELAEANEEDKKAVEIEMLEKIKSLPPNYREYFRKLNITGLQLFLATHAIELLIKRNMQLHHLPDDIGAIFGPGGTIGFGKIAELLHAVSWECDIVVPANTTVLEISHVARIDEETAKKTAMFIACSLHYCGTLIPNFWAVVTTATSGILQLVKKEE